MGRVKSMLPEQRDPVDDMLRAPEPDPSALTPTELRLAASTLRLHARLGGAARVHQAAAELLEAEARLLEDPGWVGDAVRGEEPL